MRTRNMKISFIMAAVMIAQTVLPIGGAQASGDTEIVAINCSNDAGDYAYFDSNYCYTSANPHYENFTYNMGNNYIELYRMDYQNPKRKGYIYTERTETTTPCSFDIALVRSNVSRYPKKVYDNILISTDFKSTNAGCDSQMFCIADTTVSPSVQTCIATLGADGKFTFSDGTASDILVREREWFDFKIAVNLKQHIADVYLNGAKIKSNLALPKNMSQVNKVSYSMLEGGVGNMYFDNLSVVGLINPYTDGVETPSSIYPECSEIEAFLEGKVGFHAYGELIYKDGVKRPMNPAPIFDESSQELYVAENEIKYAFDLASLTVSESGEVQCGGKTSVLSTPPTVSGSVVYIPLKCFADEVLGKYVFSFKTGFFVVSDKNEILDTSSWVYPSFRPDSSQITLWNDVDFLNAFLQYERPDAAKLKADFEAAGSTGHPRVLINKTGFDSLREAYATDSDYARIASKVINSADVYFKKAALTYKYDDAMRTLNTANEMMQRFLYWGYAYQITGNAKYVDRAYKEIQAAAKFPDFNTSHIIDSGTYAMALAIAYDWFYEGFNDEQRAFAAEVCHEKALKTLASGMYGRLTSTSAGSNRYGSFRWKSNYNSIVVGGCINAAVATLECDEDYCYDVIKNGLRGYEYTLSELMPGGGWNEAPGYWNYAMEFLDFGLSTLNTCFGSDYCLSKSMGMESTLKFAVASLGAAGLNNFHDCGVSRSNSFAEFMYLSKLYRNKTAYDMRMQEIITIGVSPSIGDVLYYDRNYFDSEDADMSKVNYIRGTELFSVRDNFVRGDSQFYFSTHFGTTNGYHQHNDCGTFVLDMMGERWAEDLGSENYNLQNELGYREHEIYRKRAEGHNVMVLNPEKFASSMEQKTNKFVPVSEYKYNDSEAYVKADMSDVYSEASNMQLGYYVDQNAQSVTMRNEFVLNNDDSQIYWFMHTKADVTIDGNTAYLKKGNKCVKVEFVTNADNAQISRMDAVPLPTSPQVPEQNKNADYSKVAISLKSSGYTTLTVKISALDDDSEIMTRPLDTWYLNGDKADDVSLFTGKSASDFSSFVRGNITDVTGIGGKDDVDPAVKVEIVGTDKDNAGAYYDYLWGEADSSGYWSEAGGDGYLIASANLFAGSDDIRFVMYTSQNGNLSEYVIPEKDMWNNITVVYDRKRGMAKTIFNGIEGEYRDCMLGAERSDSHAIRNAVRLFVDGNNTGDFMYIDDVKIYTSKVDIAPEIPSLDSIFTVDGELLMATPGLCADSIARKSGYVTNAFSDTGFTTRLTGDTELTDGCVVVLYGEDVYSTYFLTSGSIHEPPVYIASNSSFSNPGFTVVRASCADTGGIGGKALADGCALLRGTESADSTEDFFVNVTVSDSDLLKDITVMLDVYMTDSVDNVRFATGGHVSLSSTIKPEMLTANAWNNIALIHRAATAANELYINGVRVSTVSCDIRSKTFRLVICPKTQNPNCSMYIDNINVVSGEIDVNALYSSKYTISGAYIDGCRDTVAEFLKNTDIAFRSYKTTVYGSNGNQMSGSDRIGAGSYVCVTENGHIVRQYIVK